MWDAAAHPITFTHPGMSHKRGRFIKGTRASQGCVSVGAGYWDETPEQVGVEFGRVGVSEQLTGITAMMVGGGDEGKPPWRGQAVRQCTARLVSEAGKEEVPRGWLLLSRAGER